MKKILYTLGILSFGTILTSCSYQTVADADYLPQQVYMPAAVSGIYTVDDLAPEHGSARYVVDTDARKLHIPLSIYRSGIDNKTSVSTKLEINNDSVNKLIEKGALVDKFDNSPQILPLDKMEIPSIVKIPEGSEVGQFMLSIDLDFLMSHPRTRYISGISLSEANCNISDGLNYLIVEINTRFIVPQVLFSCKVIDDASFIVEFTNMSEYGYDYNWDFGDGTPSFSGASPGTHQYPSTGSYDIKLMARGVTDDIYTHIYKLKLWENITSLYISNTGPFKRKDSGGKTGLLADWLYTDNVAGSNGKGGFYLESGGVMDFYNSSKALSNAKIFQTFILPAGNYRATFSPYLFKGENDCCYLVAKGTAIPDINDIDNNSTVLGYFRWSEDIGKEQVEFEFTVENETSVTLGFVVSNTAKSRVQISNVGLYR